MKYESPQTPICSGAGSVIDTSKIFRVGDKVKTVPHPLFGSHFYTGKIDTIVDIDDSVDAMYPYKLKKLNMWIHPNELEHYIEEKEEVIEEKELGKEDNFPTKELNLCELLKDCEGEYFYCPIHNKDVKLRTIATLMVFEYGDGMLFNAYKNGSTVGGGKCMIFPSRALYEKYPLNPYSAWMEWKEERKPKRWRAEEDGRYWYVASNGNAIDVMEANNQYDTERYEFGNYFRTKEEAQHAAEAVRETLMKFHELNQKQ